MTNTKIIAVVNVWSGFIMNFIERCKLCECTLSSISTGCIAQRMQNASIRGVAWAFCYIFATNSGGWASKLSFAVLFCSVLKSKHSFAALFWYVLKWEHSFATLFCIVLKSKVCSATMFYIVLKSKHSFATLFWYVLKWEHSSAALFWYVLKWEHSSAALFCTIPK